MMRTERLRVRASQLEQRLLPRLRGEVFHVTTRDGLAGIRRSRAIRHNRDGAFPFGYGQSKVSYGRLRGYVCLFDFRNISDEDIEQTAFRFRFLNPSYAENRPAFLILKPEAHGELIPWTAAGGDFTLMLIPRAEAWFPGDIPIALVDRALCVEVLDPPPSGRDLIAQVLRSLPAEKQRLLIARARANRERREQTTRRDDPDDPS